MNSRVKRSDAGYGLRRVSTKRRWDEDFEYYFSKMNPEGEAEDAVKRPVGRPRKQPPAKDLEDVVGLREEEVVTLDVETTSRGGEGGACMSDAMLRKLCELGSDDKVECNVCHKLLKPSSVRQHVRTHYGVKPYACFLCDAKFTRKGDVDRHIRIVHYKDKPFKCCKCQRGFGDRRNLRWHLKNHDKKLFYVCDVCGFKFGKRVYWENHVRYIHPPPPPPLDQDDVGVGVGVGAVDTVIIHVKPSADDEDEEDDEDVLQLLQQEGQEDDDEERLVEVAVGEEGVRSVEYVDKPVHYKLTKIQAS